MHIGGREKVIWKPIMNKIESKHYIEKKKNEEKRSDLSKLTISY